MIDKRLFYVVFSEEEEDRTEEKTQELVDKIDAAVGIAKFVDEDGKELWGVLIDKVLAAKKFLKEQEAKSNDSCL